MKKAISVLLCIMLLLCSVFAFSGCTKMEELSYRIVLITDGSDINDGGYNSSAWNGIKEWAEESGESYRYYQPVLTDGELTLSTIEKYVKVAADRGAEYIVFPGEKFSVAAYEIAPSYSDVNFILLDALPHAEDDETMRMVPNVMSVQFDVLQSGFLAGYLTVLQENTQLGYFGSASTEESSKYGKGFVEGAAYAADQLGIPVILDYADYDSSFLDYDYSITIEAVYEKVADVNDTCYQVVVENGNGSGTYKNGDNITVSCDEYNDSGQKFDHWECVSNTEGVKDKKIDLSTTKKNTANLIVGSCDCTITAVYVDTDESVGIVRVTNAEGTETYDTICGKADSAVSISAPAASTGMVFDHWVTSGSEDDIADINAAETEITISSGEVTLTPVYVISETPTYRLTVIGGTGSGSYLSGDLVELVADLPEDGYMFSHWKNYDSQGNATGISMENEYSASTSFEMVNRYSSICTSMYNKGVTAIFAGGNDIASVVYDSKNSFDQTNLSVIGSGIEESGASFSVVKSYGEAVKDCLNSFTGGSITVANCSTEGIYASIAEDSGIYEQYQTVYQALADGSITLSSIEKGAGYDFSKIYSGSKCLTLNAWYLDISSIQNS